MENNLNAAQAKSEKSNDILSRLASYGCTGIDIANSLDLSAKTIGEEKKYFQQPIETTARTSVKGNIDIQRVVSKMSSDEVCRCAKLVKKSSDKAVFSFPIVSKKERTVDIEILSNGTINLGFVEDCNEVCSLSDNVMSEDEAVARIKEKLSSPMKMFLVSLEQKMSSSVFDYDSIRAISFRLFSIAYENDWEAIRDLSREDCSVTFLFDKNDLDGDGDFLEVKICPEKEIFFTGMVNKNKIRDDISFSEETVETIFNQIVSFIREKASVYFISSDASNCSLHEDQEEIKETYSSPSNSDFVKAQNQIKTKKTVSSSLEQVYQNMLCKPDIEFG